MKKTLGSWINFGHCKAVYETFFTYDTSSCGPGLQEQRRTCNHGTFDECTEADTTRQVSCVETGTALPDCPQVFTDWETVGVCIPEQVGQLCGHGTQLQSKNCTAGLYSDGTIATCDPEVEYRNISCSDAGTSLEDCPKDFGKWINEGRCCGPTSGPGIQKQVRDCIDGTTETCEEADITTQDVECWSNYGENPCSNYDGIANVKGDVCCDSNCGVCGGSGCHQRFGTDSTSCCGGKIRDNGEICGKDKQKAPCIQEEITTLPPCERKFGDWEDDGNCVPTEQNDEKCGPQVGKQKQKRTCEEGTHDKCTAENKEREIDCATAETKKVGHYSVENMEENCGGKIRFGRKISLITGLVYEG